MRRAAAEVIRFVWWWCFGKWAGWHWGRVHDGRGAILGLHVGNVDGSRWYWLWYRNTQGVEFLIGKLR